MNHSARVLLVDDDRPTLRVYERALTADGYEVVTADDGVRAQQRLEETPFDVVVSDIVMPGLDGLGLLRLVRARYVDMPVVLMTASPELRTAVQAVEWGATRYLVKPVELDLLTQTVADAVRLHRVAHLKRQLWLSTMDALEPGADDPDVGRFTAALRSLWMAYQPIVAWEDRTVYAYEALLRTDFAALGKPERLIEAAASLGRLHVLGRTIRGCVASALADAPPRTQVFVNLHPHDLLDDQLYSPAAPLSRFSTRIVLEITERASLDEVDNIAQRIGRLRERGFRLAIDDLGAGYSGLASLAALQPSIVKIDMSLVRNIDQRHDLRRIITAMTSMCRDLGYGVVAEGVETVAERDALTACGCSLLQGYLFARPAPGFNLPAL